MVESCYPLDWTFFGLGLNYKPIVHREIFFLVYNGGGGYTFSDVYNMPIWLRRFHIKCLTDTVQEKHEIIQKQNKEVKRNARKR
jgi:hypothetical protein